MTFIAEKDGLNLGAFRQSVNAQVLKDFPEWTQLIQQIQAVR
jgi:hypothetical protein